MRTLLACLLALLAALAGCDRGADPAEADQGRDHAAAQEHDHAAAGEHDHAAAQEHDHAHAEESDLDRPVDELFAAECEHEMKTHECGECRYEVGVARAPRDLFEAGLLRATTPVRERVAVPLVLTGEVQFDERRVIHVSPPVDGVIREVHAALGDRVRRGAALVTVESAELAAARAEQREAQSLLRLAEADHERAVMLREREISAQRDFQQSAQALEAARIRAESAQAAVGRLGAGEAASGGRLVLRAPADGTILAMHAVVGEEVVSDESLATVGDSRAVWVWADLYERDLARLAPGAARPAVVRVDAYPDAAFPGTVDFVSPAMDEATRTVKVRVAVDNPDGRLLAGMFARVEVQLPGDERALVVPAAAVLEDEGRSFVFVHHRDDYYVRRPVTAGRLWGDHVEVVAGLAGGETVVADGAFLLKSDVLRSKMGAGCAD